MIIIKNLEHILIDHPTPSNPEGKRYRIFLDASALKEANCLRRLFYTAVKGLRKKSYESYITGFGTAFHKAIAHHIESDGNDGEATRLALEYYRKLQVPEKEVKRSMTNLGLSVISYFDHWQENNDGFQILKDGNGKALVEQVFTLPYYQDYELEIYIAGTIDAIYKSANGEYLLIRDHKTTSSWNIKEYFNSYQLSPQMMFYHSALKVLFPELNSHNIASQINGIFISNKGYQPQPTKFERSDLIFFSPEQIMQNEQWIKGIISDLIVEFKTYLNVPVRNDQMISPNFTACDGKFGLCPFFDLCSAPSDEYREAIEETEFSSIVYDPSKFQA